MKVKPPVVIVGKNETRIWGMTVAERTRRMALQAGFAFDGTDGDRDAAALLVNMAFVFDPAWLRHFGSRPGEALIFNGVPVIAHCRNGAERAQVREAMTAGTSLPAGSTLMATDWDKGPGIVNEQLRKREKPFVNRLTDETVKAAERASYFGAYKGVTDLLTKYLWPEWALVLTRLAARFHVTPNMVTTVGAIFCVLATQLFWYGDYWSGMACGLVFMVLDTVDGKLARCTITSSTWGNIFDHGIDLIHPPFWWYAWGVGLVAYGRPLDRDLFVEMMIVIMAGYVVQRIIEGIFLRLYGMHIHVWHKIDSQFRLVTARRNPNMVILFASMLVLRPDLGLVAVAWWTAICCLFHLVRLFQALVQQVRGEPIRSWLG
jgi:phosphatidylglycerophosphate synthase